MFGDCEVIDADGQRLMRSGLADLHGVRKQRLKTALSAEIVGNWGVPGPVLMYRRDAMLELGGYVEGDIIEDWNTYLGFVSRGWLAFVDTVVSQYRLHGENTMPQPEHQLRINQNLLAAAVRNMGNFGLSDRYRLLQQMLQHPGSDCEVAGPPGSVAPVARRGWCTEASSPC